MGRAQFDGLRSPQGALVAGSPQKTLKKGVGDKNIAVTFGGVTFNPGEYLYADEDGVLVSNQPLC